jgi:hypothetical protein
MVKNLILVPAIVTLAVTILRLVGELNHWSPTFFNRAAGGGGALVGIVWLVPIFGIYFGLKLARAGQGPKSRGRALGIAALGLAVAFALGAAASQLPNPLVRVVAFNVAFAVGALIVYRGWPELGAVELAYGIAARVPVAIVMLVAMLAQWGTHYELGPPGLPEMGVLPMWVLVGLVPQMVFWVGFTVIVGGLFGSLAVLLRKPV